MIDTNITPTTINPFSDVAPVQTVDPENKVGNRPNLQNLNSFKMGQKESSIRGDAKGIWAGGVDFETAPFSISNLGVLKANLSPMLPFGIAVGDAEQSLTTTETDIDEVTITFVLTKTCNVLLFAEVTISIFSGGTPTIYLSLDNTHVCNEYGLHFKTVMDFDSKTTFDIVTLTAGSHTFKMRGKTNIDNNAEITRTYSRVGYLVLGS